MGQRAPTPAEAAVFKDACQELGLDDSGVVQGVMVYLCWAKWRKMPHELFDALCRRYDPRAFDQLAKAFQMFYRWSWGKLNRWDDLRIKGDERHTFLMFAGIIQGIDRLTENELVGFFDAMCPCGIDTHSISALRKLRDRTRSKLARSIEAVRRQSALTVGIRMKSPGANRS